MERNRKYVMTEDDRSNSATALFAPRKEGQVMRKPLRQPGSLEIIENGERKIEKEKPSTESPSGSWSRASIGSVPPRSDSSLSRRTITPTKQISLQAVRRKEESSDLFVDNIDIDLDSVALDSTRQRTRKWRNDDDFRPLSENSFAEDEFIDLGVADDYSKSSKKHGVASSIEDNSIERKPKSDIKAKGRSEPAVKVQTSYKQGDGRKEEPSSEDDDDDEDEEVKLRAPNELLMEFVDCLMKKDFPNANKLCKMILLYEPENTEALTFQPLIEEKMQLDAKAAEEGESDDEDEDNSDDSDDSDDDDDDDTTSSDDDSSEESAADDAGGNDKIENIPSTSTSKGPASSDMKGANSVRAWKPAS